MITVQGNVVNSDTDCILTIYSGKDKDRLDFNKVRSRVSKLPAGTYTARVDTVNGLFVENISITIGCLMKLSVCGMTVNNYKRSKADADRMKFYRNRTWVGVNSGQSFDPKNIQEGIAVYELTGIVPIYCVVYNGTSVAECQSQIPSYVESGIQHCLKKNVPAAWEIQNEPDLFEYFKMGTAQYVPAMLKPTWDRCKKYNVQIIGGNYSWDLNKWDSHIPDYCNAVGGHGYVQTVGNWSWYNRLAALARGLPVIVTEGGVGLGKRIKNGENPDKVIAEWKLAIPQELKYVSSFVSEWCTFIMTPSKKPGNNIWNISTNSPAALFNDDGSRRWGYDAVWEWRKNNLDK